MRSVHKSLNWGDACPKPSLSMQADPASSAPSVPVALLPRRACTLWLLAVAGFLAAGMAILLATGANSFGWRAQTVTAVAVAICATFVLLWWQLWSLKPAARFRQQLPAEFEQLAALLPDGVVIADGDTVLYANPAASSIPGIGGGGTVQLLAGLSAHDPRTSKSELPVQMLRTGGEPFHAMVITQQLQHDGRACQLFVIRDLSELEHGRTALAASNSELQAMAGRLFSLQEDERRSISRDLHDDIGQAITAMKLAACAARDEDNKPRRQDDIDQIIELADSTVIKLRNLSMLLRPPQLDALGLEAALRWQAGLLFRSTEVELLLDVEALPRRPSNEVEQACFRIAQESLTNALRHACASQVSLSLRNGSNGDLHLQVVDDGEGFDPAGPRGLGMIVMRERAQSAGGSLHIETAPGAGTRIDLRLPYALDAL